MRRFTGKVIVITGATSGIGKALALQLAAKDVQLILAARRMDELQKVKEECENRGATCSVLFIDMEAPESITDCVSIINRDFKVIDVLINNAGISQRSKAEETSTAVDRRIMEINFFGQVALTKALWPLIIKSSHANIVLLSSIVGSFGFSQRSAYSASKHALEGYFESWMIENNRSNVHFTIASPGRIFTNLSYSALKADGSAYHQMDTGLANGISAENCAKKIINGIIHNKRKVYIVRKEIVMILLRKCFPYLFFKIAKNLKSV